MTAIFFRFFDDFMSNINCGIGVLHVKRQILTYLLFHLIGHTKRCIPKK